ncbi:ATP-binding cassette domain-containing protein [Parasediminibacterium sp. JCM 36343]|uniref:ATP-binding cassette domain-containing protein n=1 Tax=Parasediminibacterium sp. JCM 36343 TaxID=3374279 RepID=UPI00397CE261
MANHWAVFLSNNADKHGLIHQLLSSKATNALATFNGQKGALFSTIALKEFIDEEALHEELVVSKEYNRSIRTLSSGEQKKALLAYLLAQKPDFIVLDNPFDNLDIATQASLLQKLIEISEHISIVQFINRAKDLLPFIANAASLEGNQLIFYDSVQAYLSQHLAAHLETLPAPVPKPIRAFDIQGSELVKFTNVTVSYEGRVIVKKINWTIKKGDFWQLVGPNGAGKTTLLTMITGDNPKAYGQDLILFGRKKGSGETVWEIKEKIGYLTPAMTDLFSTRHTVGQMIVSGFLDSIGLYKQPSDIQLRLADEWLHLIGMVHLKNKPFCNLTLGQQRMALIARAMVKHPPLLILDEAMSGLDDANVELVSMLINKIAAESTTAILYVSHRVEEGLAPDKIFALTPSEGGSKGTVL